MKKFFFSMVVFMGLVNLTYAQGNFELHAGGVFPGGKFGEYDDDKDWIDDGYGFAATGFTAGMKFFIPTNVNNLSIIIGADLLYNGLSSDFQDDFEEANEDNKDFEVTYSKFLNVPLMSGINYAYPVTDGTKIFGEFALGLNYSMITEFKSTYTEYDFDYENSRSFEASMKIGYEASMKIGYRLGLGVMFNDKFCIQLSHNALGSHKYDYTETMSYDGKEYEDDGKTKKDLDITALTLTFGIRL